MQPSKEDNFQISQPLPEDKEEMKSLWQTTFQDSDEFVDMFFNRIYKPENALVIKKDGKIVSALQMIPYEIKIGDNIIPAAYICGVCTLTFERGKGLMNILMNEAMDVIRQKGYGITTLIPAHPWLFDVYRKYGYIYPVNYNIERYNKINEPNRSDTVDEHNNDSFSGYDFTTYTGRYYTYFDKKQRERQCVILHNEYDIENVLLDLTYDNGNIFVALHEDTPVGIAFAIPDSKKEVTIKELLYDNTQIKKVLIYHILNRYNAETAKVRIPQQEAPEQEINATDSSTINKKTIPYGLACILYNQTTDITNLYMTLMLD
jgi:Predicted acetyltransferase involved in intracellular survival and related acetyltransferases